MNQFPAPGPFGGLQNFGHPPHRQIDAGLSIAKWIMIIPIGGKIVGAIIVFMVMMWFFSSLGF